MLKVSLRNENEEIWLHDILQHFLFNEFYPHQETWNPNIEPMLISLLQTLVKSIDGKELDVNR